MKGFVKPRRLGRVLSILILLFIGSRIYANDLVLTGKGIELYVDSESGSFYLQDPVPENAGLKYLLFRDTPPTSYITLYHNGAPYRVNDSLVEVSEPLAATNRSLTGTYIIEDTQYKIKFMITNSTENQSDTILLVVSVKNEGEEEIVSGARILLDTYYEERWGEPKIYTSGSEELEKERSFLSSTVPAFLFNGVYDVDDGFQEGLFIYPYLNSIVASKIIVGNWKKLDETETDYEVEPKAEYRYNDYSSKDAAIAVYFDEIFVSVGETVNYGIALSRNEFTFTQYVGNRPVVEMVEAADNVEVVTDFSIPDMIEITNETSELPETNVAVATNVPPQTNAVVQETPELADLTIDTNGMSYEDTLRLNELIVLQKQLEALERLTGILEKMESGDFGVASSQLVVTNDNTQDIAELSTLHSQELEELRIQYEAEIESAQLEYEAKLAEQETLFNEEIEALEEQISSDLTEARWARAMEKIDEALIELDTKIAMIEQLEKLDLDFSSMPEEELDTLKDTIDEMEKYIYLMSVD